jgi:hypothetical protein
VVQRAAVYVIPMLLIGSFNFTSLTSAVVMYAIKTRLIVIYTALDFALGIGLTD